MSLANNWNKDRSSFLFHCPGCDFPHVVAVTGDRPKWAWTGTLECPTFSPSLLVTVPPHPEDPAGLPGSRLPQLHPSRPDPR